LQEVIEVFFISLTIILSVITLEVRSLFRASIIFAVMCVSVAILFWILGAYYVAVFQLLVYAGAMIVLLLAVVALTAGREREIK
jgi:NADH-quinone oxidoreductase subunit J